MRGRSAFAVALVLALVWGARSVAEALGPRAQGPQRPTAAVHVTVVDDLTGLPVRAARVAGVQPLPAGNSFPEVLTNRQGQALLAGLPTGRVCLNVEKAGYETSACPVDPTGASTITLAANEYRDHVVVRLSRGGGFTGHVLDEAGEPVVGLQVTAFRGRWGRTGRMFARAGVAETDDTGAFRIAGLGVGDYLVGFIPTYDEDASGDSETAPADGADPGREPPPLRPLAIDVGARRVIAVDAASPTPPVSTGAAHLGYGPTFAPGASPEEATVLTLTRGEWRTADLRLMPTSLTRVTGRVVSPPGTSLGAWGGNLLLAGPTDRFVQGLGYRVSVGMSGEFAIPFVVPGAYIFNAGERSVAGPDPTLFADVPVRIDARPRQDVIVPLQPGAEVSGRVVIASGPTPPADFRGFSILLESNQAGLSQARVESTDPDGRFVLAHLSPGLYAFRVAGVPSLALLSATADGRDVADTLFQAVPGARTDDLVLTVTDRLPTLAGQVRREGGGPDVRATVVIFSTDRSFWAPPTRRVVSAQAGTDGRFEVGRLVPGDYWVVATRLEPETWRDPAVLARLAGGATQVSLAEGDRRTVDLKLFEKY